MIIYDPKILKKGIQIKDPQTLNFRARQIMYMISTPIHMYIVYIVYPYQISLAYLPFQLALAMLPL